MADGRSLTNDPDHWRGANDLAADDWLWLRQGIIPLKRTAREGLPILAEAFSCLYLLRCPERQNDPLKWLRVGRSSRPL